MEDNYPPLKFGLKTRLRTAPAQYRTGCSSERNLQTPFQPADLRSEASLFRPSLHRVPGLLLRSNAVWAPPLSSTPRWSATDVCRSLQVLARRRPNSSRPRSELRSSSTCSHATSTNVYTQCHFFWQNWSAVSRILAKRGVISADPKRSSRKINKSIVRISGNRQSDIDRRSGAPWRYPGRIRNGPFSSVGGVALEHRTIKVNNIKRTSVITIGENTRLGLGYATSRDSGSPHWAAPCLS